MSEVKVSILVPVYNTSEFLEKCLDTLVSQTLKEIEIICVNDGSTDNSLEILERYAKRDSRVVIVNKPNGGLPSARNAGIENAKGEYLGFVDSDDFVETSMFKRMYDTAKKKDAEIVVCGAHIFPEEPRATDWFYDVLSPRTIHYKKYTPDILFKEKGARPFVWRNLIKRDLLMRENIRLREDIVLGEDQALQFRVFPKARGISFISDKLYHYCWYRPGSIMAAAAQGKKIAAKLEKHANLCLHVLDEVKKLPDYEKMKKDTLFWSVDLLYPDFIKLSLADRHRIAKAMTAKWNEFGYGEYYKSFPQHINDMFDYFYFIASEKEPTAPKVSVIVNLYNSKFYITDFKDSYLSQTLANTEIIFLNNASDGDTYMHLHRWLTSDARVRVINQSYDTRANTFNLGLSLAEGDAVVFADAHDIFSERTALERLYAEISGGADVSGSQDITSDSAENRTVPSLYSLMIRRAFLEENELLFEENNSLSTKVFALSALSLAKKVGAASGASLFRERALWHRDWIYKEEARDLLSGYVSLLELTAKLGMKKEHLRLIDELNSDLIVEKITNASRPYTTPTVENPKGENSQSNIFSLICKINEVICPELVGSTCTGVYKLLSSFVLRKNSFLTFELGL